jgi:dTDP-4-amino-4,6-dideoxygalactose transaminase
MTREPSELQAAPEGAWYYEQHLLGYNYRLTDVHAALGRSQLQRMDALHAARCALADRYDVLLADLPLKLPVRRPDRVSSWHLYAVEVLPHARRTRAEVFQRLRAAGIGVNVHYIPVHLQPYYAALGFRPGDFPAAEAYYRGAISLPLFPALDEAQQQYVAAQLREALGEAA